MRRSSRTSSFRIIVVAYYVCFLVVLFSRSKHRVHATLFMNKMILTLYNILEVIVECPLAPPPLCTHPPAETAVYWIETRPSAQLL